MRLLPLLLLLAGPALAQPTLTPAQRAEVVAILRDTLRADPSILRDALAALEADDARRQQAAQAVALAGVADKLVDPADPVMGQPGARITLVEFYDTRCPYCRRMMGTLAELLKSNTEVRVVFKDMPILGAASRLESRALLAAQKQGGYLRMQEAVMRAGGTPTREGLAAEAARLGLDGAALLRDMDDPAIEARLRANIALAGKIGIQGTPALVIGHRLIEGETGLDELRHAVAAAR